MLLVQVRKEAGANGVSRDAAACVCLRLYQTSALAVIALRANARLDAAVAAELAQTNRLRAPQLRAVRIQCRLHL